MEYDAVTAPGSGSLTLGVRIRRVGGAATSPFMKYIAYTNGAPLSIEHSTDSGAVSPDAASARGALTVAASPWNTPAVPEPYSSRGPVAHRFTATGAPLAVPDVRQKPDLAGPDAVSTSRAGLPAVPRHERGGPRGGGHRGPAPVGAPGTERRRTPRRHDEPRQRTGLPGGRQPRRRLRRRVPARRPGTADGARRHAAGDQPGDHARDRRRAGRLVPRAGGRRAGASRMPSPRSSIRSVAARPPWATASARSRARRRAREARQRSA